MPKRSNLEKKVEKQIGDNVEMLVEKALEVARGIWVERKMVGGIVRVYLKEPDFTAIVYLINRLFGTPVQKSEVKETKRGLLVVEGIIKNLAQGKRLKEAIEIKALPPEGGEAPNSNEPA